MLCPKCKSDSAHRSHRTGLRDLLAGIAGYQPYRCRQCKYRFPSRRFASPKPATAAVRGVEREISSTQGALRWKRKRRNLVLYGSALILFGVILYFLTRAPAIGD